MKLLFNKYRGPTFCLADLEPGDLTEYKADRNPCKQAYELTYLVKLPF